MSNVLFVTRNHVAGAVLSAGSEGLPVENLQHPKLSVRWQSADLAPASTTLGIDFGPTAGSGPTARHRVLALAALSGNFSPACQAVASLGDVWKEHSEGLLTGWDSGGLAPVFPALADDPDLLHGLRGYLPPDVPDLWTKNAFFVPPTDIRQAHRYGRIDFVDLDNPAGFLEVGGLVAGPGLVPPADTGIQPGWSFEMEDPSDVATGESGYDSFRRRLKRRVLRFSMAWLDFERVLETHAQVFDVHHGSSRSFLTLPFPDLGALWVLGTWGRFRRLSGVNEAAAFHFQKAFELAEVIR